MADKEIQSNGSDDTSQHVQLLSASYKSPTNAPFSYTSNLPSSSTTTVDKGIYLAALRKATLEMQDVINRELTRRMEEDKVRQATGMAGTRKGGVDDSKEEENYGEEVPEED